MNFKNVWLDFFARGLFPVFPINSINKRCSVFFARSTPLKCSSSLSATRFSIRSTIISCINSVICRFIFYFHLVKRRSNRVKLLQVGDVVAEHLSWIVGLLLLPFPLYILEG